jgi:hypothetical protein
MADVATSGSDFWDRFPLDPRLPAHAHLRVGDAERHLVLDVLAEAYADGRIDRGEHEQRLTVASSAQRLGDLPACVDDLVAAERSPSRAPLALRPTDIDARAVARFEKERREAIWGFVSSSAICWVIWALVMFGEFAWPAIVMVASGMNLGRVLYQRDDIIASERRRLERRAAKKRALPPGPRATPPAAPPAASDDAADLT